MEQLFYKQIILSELNNYQVNCLIIDRTGVDEPVRKDRKIIVIPLIEGWSLSEDKLLVEDIMLNPIPIIYQPTFIDEYTLYNPATSVNTQYNLSLIKNWSFKKYVHIGPIEEVPFHLKWNISLDDYRSISGISYDGLVMDHLEFYDIMPWSFLSFKLAIEICKIRDEDPSKSIKDFRGKLQKSYVYRYLFNHSLVTLPFNEIPSIVKGKFTEESNYKDKLLDIRTL